MDFINREQEREQLTRYINSEHCPIVLLAGTSGVGKTGLVRFLLDQVFTQRPALRVMVSKSTPETIESSYYFNMLYNEVRQYTKDNRHLLKRPLAYISNNRSTIIAMVGDWIKNKLGFSDSLRLIQPVAEKDLLQKKIISFIYLSRVPLL